MITHIIGEMVGSIAAVLVLVLLANSVVLISSFNPTVIVYKDKQTVSKHLCSDIINNAKIAINKKGSFNIAVPGGSVLKLLSTLKEHKEDKSIEWSKMNFFYVNHKCVPNDDVSSTHFKAKSIFLDTLCEINALPIYQDISTVTPGHNTAEHYYTEVIRKTIPMRNGLPIFDYMLIGMGADGHIGSLYPDRKEVLVKDKIIVTVDKKVPTSISLSLPVMNAATSIRAVLLGEDKGDSAVTAVLRKKELAAFPGCGLGTNTIWMLDAAAAACLKKERIDLTIC